ncbi:MAG TPA: response regulator [Terriglobia bacterium]|jgi:FixJ family two-component response regulator|nr:response regulator [Terriglobia bacterium]
MTPLLAVVDDDISVRESLESLIRSAGMAVSVFGSAEEFLNSAHPNQPDCLILDLRMPGMSGIELHRHLRASDCRVPVVFMTAHGYDDQARSEASSDWTVACLNKPFSDDELLDAIHAALRLKSNNHNR